MYMHVIHHQILLQRDDMIAAAADRLRIVTLGQFTVERVRELDRIPALYPASRRY